MKFHSADLMIDFRNRFIGVFACDYFARIATTIVILGAFSHSAWAGLDLSVGSTVRSYPLSGVIEAESGYGILLYGSNGSPPWYGYARPRILGASSVTYNSLDGALEIFPLSFLGVRAGGEAIQNDVDYTSYDCALYDCRGRFTRTYAEAELTLGAGRFFLQGAWRRERWAKKTPSATEFIDPTSGFSLNGQSDRETVYRGMAGIKFSPRWSFVALLRYSQSDQTRAFSRFPYGVVRYTNGGFSAGVGGGRFESSLKKKDPTAVAFLRWEIRPSVALR